VRAIITSFRRAWRSTTPEASRRTKTLLAAAYDIPVIPHGGGLNGSTHYSIATVNAPWAELFLPAPGGPREVYQMFEENYAITRGPEGIYTRPLELPGWGMDPEVIGEAQP
jgi:L-alanine-DL-glutamate epimerase-like enolase superfamily enzyme